MIAWSIYELPVVTHEHTMTLKFKDLLRATSIEKLFQAILNVTV